MLNKAIATTAVLFALSAPLASAYSLVDTKVVKGTIGSVDTQQNMLVIEKSSGASEVLKFGSDANVYLDGNVTDLGNLQAGNTVQIKHKIYTPATEQIEGEIVALNRKDKSAHIRVEGNNIVEVKFSENLSVDGTLPVSSFADLRKGHQVVVRYAN